MKNVWRKAGEPLKTNANWNTLAEKETLDTLPIFIREILKVQETEEDFQDAITASIIATLSSISYELETKRIPKLTTILCNAIKYYWGVSGSAFIQVRNLDRILFPGSDTLFENRLTEEEWAHYQQKASTLLAEIAEREEEGDLFSGFLIKHLEGIVDGKVPYGFKIIKKEEA